MDAASSEHIGVLVALMRCACTAREQEAAELALLVVYVEAAQASGVTSFRAILIGLELTDRTVRGQQRTAGAHAN